MSPRIRARGSARRLQGRFRPESAIPLLDIAPMRILLAAALLAAATPALADSTTGVILAFDRQADVIVMEDKTIWQLNPTTLIPADLAAGDRITIEFTSAGDDGVRSVDALVKAE